MADNFFIACNDVLGIRTNLPKFKWSFGITVPPASERDYDRCAIKLRLVVDKHLDWSESDRPEGKYHYFSGR